MKTVFNNRELPHIWISGNQDNGKGSNLFFEKNVIYSYGRHYAAAAYYGNSVLINSHNYSNSTAKHLSYIRQSLPDYKTVYSVPKVVVYLNIPMSHMPNLKHFVFSIDESLKLAARAKQRKESYLNAAFGYQLSLTNYIDAFQLTTLIDDDIRRVLGYELALNSTILGEIKQREKEKAAKLLEEKKEQIQNWLSGGNEYIYNLKKTFLRLSGENVETSHSACVPVREAKILFNLIQSGKDIKGFKIGNYTTIGMTENVLTIGCHKIEKSEIDRFAKSVNW